jgi:NAD(P)-dependent dehydrogenase (short-subunit alcohol dehydrogenase family)
MRRDMERRSHSSTYRALVCVSQLFRLSLARAPARIASELGLAPSHAALIAGGWAGGTNLVDASDERAWSEMLYANLETVHRALRALLPPMVKARCGSVVVVGSRAVERPWSGAGQSAYVASKAGAVALAQAVAAEVLESGVRINAILPSTIDTPANRNAMPDADFTRWVSAESAAGVIGFLLSDDARDISGAAIPIYGRV